MEPRYIASTSKTLLPVSPECLKIDNYYLFWPNLLNNQAKSLLRYSTGTLNILLQKIFKACWAFRLLLCKVQLHTIAHQNCIGSFLEELHKGPGDWKRHNCEQNRHKDRWLNLFLVRRNVGNEEIADCTAHRDDESSTKVDKQFCRAMANKKLSCASKHEVKWLFSGVAKVLATDGHHYISILCDKPDNPFETSNQACRTFN